MAGKRWRWLLVVVVLFVAFSLLDGPVAVSTTVAGTLCTDPGDYAVEDVRIVYDRTTMVGGEAVEIRGTQAYYMDGITKGRTPRTFRIGRLNREEVTRLMGLIARSGVFCLDTDYSDRVILRGSEPVYDELTVSTSDESKSVSITSTYGRGGPARVRDVINATRERGQSLREVDGATFCDRAPANATGTISNYCAYRSRTLDRTRFEDRILS